jgi:hypothetical protein
MSLSNVQVELDILEFFSSETLGRDCRVGFLNRLEELIIIGTAFYQPAACKSTEEVKTGFAKRSGLLEPHALSIWKFWGTPLLALTDPPLHSG